MNTAEATPAAGNAQPAAPQPVLELQGVSKSFAGHAALSEASLAIRPGEIVALLGRNGAGKTTLMRLSCGLVAPDSGTIRICGKDAVLPEARLSLGYLPENAPPLPGYRVCETLRLFAALHGIQAPEEAIAEAARRCELGPVMGRMAEQLSKGYRHRLGLAQAMLHHPRIMLLDEPTDGLDPQQKNETRRLLRDISGECAILLSTHLLEEVPELCTRVVILSRHHVVYDGPVPDNLPKLFKELA